jgi:hypothetical protein
VFTQKPSCTQKVLKSAVIGSCFCLFRVILVIW